jgi:PAS domain S-box-containing protein
VDILDQFRHSAPLYTGEFHRAVRKGNTAILKTVVEGFAQISESEYEDINHRWFGTEAKAFHPNLRFILIVLGALVVIVLFLIVWNRTLREKIRERTMRLEEEIILNIKKTEALRESEEKYHALVDSASDAILIADFEGNLLDVNKKAEELLDYTREELLGMNITQIHPKEELEKIIKSFREIAEGRLSSSSDTKVLKKDGTSVPVDITGNAIEFAGGKVVQGIFRDITSRKHAELLIKESEERYRVLVEYSNDGVALVEGDLHIYVNQKFLDIFGYNKPEDIIGKSPFMVVHPDDLEMVLEYNRKRQRGEPVPPKYEFRGMRKDGSILYIEVSAAKITYNGKPGFACTYQRHDGKETP